jgi:hypothetical protein
LLIRSFDKLLRASVGFNPEQQLLSLEYVLPENKYSQGRCAVELPQAGY